MSILEQPPKIVKCAVWNLLFVSDFALGTERKFFLYKRVLLLDVVEDREVLSNAVPLSV
jgi:hypothetical protein